ncbi:predicted protein [Chaetomium globosum CBS 148.51]|uniref:Uncharacterized protein n=1 Tax=Chaetomium globosum (strain ATCC 6205 / CBS 148.51 / DSM 1962 / NBRC 6347 / NRRL 1970) TaxID=306901 RepID=Q2GM39_CHAGB|nr:uncharacterized protein CHGG_10965 [Chaetomium globosum CBS 148.51]EAQ83147.1 predicted protein [Chaetomium globosum CBS 148.51]
MEAKVRSFNNLPRPGNLEGIKSLGFWCLPYRPSSTRRSCTGCQPIESGGYRNQAAPAQILSLSTTRQQPEATIPFLLDAFVNPKPMDNPDMAQAIKSGLKKHGVSPALCKVGVCTAEERDILEAAGAKLSKLTESLLDIERDAVAPGNSTK